MKDTRLHIVLFTIFLTGTIGTLFIVFNEIDTKLSFLWIVGYLMYLLLFVAYSIVRVLIHARQWKASDVRGRALKFTGWFVSLSAIHFLANSLLRRPEMDNWDLGIPFGLALGLTFSDVMVWRKES
ncbi:hypothetical protein EQV77_06160 [Halobacillus fulvus]|nr:hypothetical protein EQV77_06160 [Halobacillus fulvus]